MPEPRHVTVGDVAGLGHGGVLVQILHQTRLIDGAGDDLEKAGMKFSGMSPDGILPEIVEIPDHPWFVGVQFHPELKSRPFEPHPLFTSFIAGAVDQSRLV